MITSNQHSTTEGTGRQAQDTRVGGAGPALAAVLEAHARGYAQAVRLHLEDLGPEVADELTDGLEADLADALTDAAAPVSAGNAAGARRDGGANDDVALDLVAHFGPAAAYAAELRAAAGLPPATSAARDRRGRAELRRQLRRERWDRWWAPVGGSPQWSAVRRTAGELRPVWWVARGWLVGALLVVVLGEGRFSLVPGSFGALVVLAAAVTVSVQWGRGRWLPWSWMPRVVVAGSVLAVLVAPFALAATQHQAAFASAGGVNAYDAGYAAGNADASSVSYSDGEPGDDGVWVDGMQVSNLFVYDANGDPVRDVQVFDDRGRPVRTMSPDGAEQPWSVPDVDGSWYFRPATADDGRERWNVYPLRAVPEDGMDWSDDGESWAPQVGVQPEEMPWPFLKAPTSIGGAASADPEPGASGEPSAEPSADPTGEAGGPEGSGEPRSKPGASPHPSTSSSGGQGAQARTTTAATAESD